jgi:hypothetical protein
LEGDLDKLTDSTVDPKVRERIELWWSLANGEQLLGSGPGVNGPQPGNMADRLLDGQELLIALAALRRIDPGQLPVDSGDGPTRHGVIRALHRKSGGSRLGYIVGRFWRERAAGPDGVDWDKFDKIWNGIGECDKGQHFGSLMEWAKSADQSWKCHVEEVPQDEFDRLSDLGQQFSVDVVSVIEQQEGVVFFEFAALVEDCKTNPGAAFDPVTLKALAYLRRTDKVKFEQVWDQLKQTKKVRMGELQKALDGLKAETGSDAKDDLPAVFTVHEPWPQSVDGQELVAALERSVMSYVKMLEDEVLIVVLWVVHNHIYDVFVCTPRLYITSLLKQCGKTTLIDWLYEVCRRAYRGVGLSGPALFRAIDLWHPTFLLDEIDNLFTEVAQKSGVAGDTLAILNDGHRRGGSTMRCVGDDHTPTPFSTHAPVAMAGIGRLPGTLEDRSLIVFLRRKKMSEKVERFRADRTEALQMLGRKVARWAADNRERLIRAADAAIMPEELGNRAGDNWRSLLAIADVIGGTLPERARAVAVASTKRDIDSRDHALVLLEDTCAILDALDRKGASKKPVTIGSEPIVISETAIATVTLIDQLTKLEERRWGIWNRGQKIRPDQLKEFFAVFDIRPEPEAIHFSAAIGSGEKGQYRARGYLRAPIMHAVERYLPHLEIKRK